MPLEPMARAQPRRRTNHLLMVVLTTRGLKSVQPMKPATEMQGPEEPEVGLSAEAPETDGRNQGAGEDGKAGPALVQDAADDDT